MEEIKKVGNDLEAVKFIKRKYPNGIHKRLCSDIYSDYKQEVENPMTSKFFKEQIVENTEYTVKQTTCKYDVAQQLNKFDIGENRRRYIDKTKV